MPAAAVTAAANGEETRMSINLTQAQVELVRNTFAAVSRYPLGTGLMFYQRLFSSSKEARLLFRGEIADQAQALVAMMELIVKSLDDAERLMPVVYSLGWRHAAYGISLEYYEAFGRAMVTTVEDALNAQRSPEVREAWEAAYRSIAAIMQEAAADAQAGKLPRYALPEKKPAAAD